MTSGGQVSLLVNPRAGRGKGQLRAEQVSSILRDRGIEVFQPVAVSVPEARAVAAEAVQRGDLGLVVIGGDGMCHLAVQELAETATALGIVPAGTGNDFAAALGLPGDTVRAAAAIADAVHDAGQISRLDLARTGQRWWASVLCAGFDSAVNDRANRMSWLHGPRRYDLALLAELARLRAVPMVLELDGREVELEATLVAVGNTSRYGGGIPICPRADPRDGLLDVTVVQRISRRHLIRVTPTTLRRGEHVHDPAVRTFRARSVALSVSVSLSGDVGPAVTAYADGEPIQALPVAATCIPAALGVLGRITVQRKS